MLEQIQCALAEFPNLWNDENVLLRINVYWFAVPFPSRVLRWTKTTKQLASSDFYLDESILIKSILQKIKVKQSVSESMSNFWFKAPKKLCLHQYFFIIYIHDCTQKLLLQTSLSLILIRVTGLEPIPATTGATGAVHPGKEIQTG